MITVNVDDHGAVSRFVRRFGFDVQSAVQAKLSGSVLRVRTGTLRSSINTKIDESATSVTATIGTNVKYAAVHEFGFHGTVTVRAHLRHITQAWGRPIAPTVQHVGAYSRRMNLPERSFLRSTMREMTPAFQSGIEDAAGEELRR
jgi:phage gpG-like protein